MYIQEILAYGLIVRPCSTQGETVAVDIQRIVFKIDWNLIKRYLAGLIAEYSYLNNVANGKCRAITVGSIYKGHSSAVGGGGHSVLVGFQELTAHKHLHTGDLRIWQHCHIQLQRLTSIAELELLACSAGYSGGLPAQFTTKSHSVCILPHKTQTHSLGGADAVSGVGESVCVQVVVKHDVTNVGQAEISYRESQYCIIDTGAHGIAEQTIAGEITAGIFHCVGQADACAVIYIEQRCLIY